MPHNWEVDEIGSIVFELYVACIFVQLINKQRGTMTKPPTPTTTKKINSASKATLC